MSDQSESTTTVPELGCDALLGSDQPTDVQEEYYSTNDEEFYYESPEEAAQALWDDGDCNVGDTVTVYALTFRKAQESEFLPFIAEYLQENAYDNIGEGASDWNFTREESEALQGAVAATVDKWCADNNCRSGLWWPVGKSTELRYRLTSESGDVESLPNTQDREPTK